jgi:hypothetical protein
MQLVLSLGINHQGNNLSNQGLRGLATSFGQGYLQVGFTVEGGRDHKENKQQEDDINQWGQINRDFLSRHA